MLTLLRSAVLVLALVVGACGKDATFNEIHTYIQPPEGKQREQFTATVKQVDTLPDGSREVRFHLTEKYDGFKNDQPVYRKVSKDLSLPWREAERPVPFVEGTKVSLQVDQKGKIAVVRSRASMKLWRKRSDGQIELVLQLDKDENPQQPFLRVLPNRMENFLDPGPAADIFWTDKHGLLVMSWERGGPVLDSEKSPSAGLALANEPGARAAPGHDGWRKNTKGEKNPDALIPPAQFLKIEGD